MQDLINHGYSVFNVDNVVPSTDSCPFIFTDLTDFGQTLDAFSSVGTGLYGKVASHAFDAVVHLAAIPGPRLLTDPATFRNNMLSTYHVFEAARRLGIKNIVWASSETVLGLPFETPPPYVPVDEEYPGRPESIYSLSKMLGEEMAAQFCRWDPELKIIGLRFSNIMEVRDYDAFPGFENDPQGRKWNLWAYIDARDACQAIRKSLELPMHGAEVFIIANDDTVMAQPTSELLTKFFPDIPVKKKLALNETLLSSDKAKRVLGYSPQYTWRHPAKS